MNTMVTTIGKSIPTRHYKAHVKEMVDTLL
jgi:hypothetical protein